MYIYVKLQVAEVVVVKVIVVVVDEVIVVQDLGQFYINHSTPLDGLCS